MANRSYKYAWGITALALLGSYLLIKRSKRDDSPSLLNNDNMNTNNQYDFRNFGQILPRGYRNNNPLNIRISSSPWNGKIQQSANTDGVFEQFRNMVYGYRAALVTLRTYIKKYGLNTVEKMISRWAPPSENATDDYIKHVCTIADLTPDTRVNINDKDILTKMVFAMSIIENGKKDQNGNSLSVTYGLPDMEIINEAWNII